MKTLPIIFLSLISFLSIAATLDNQNSLGTLFTTPQTRKRLDQQRRQGKFDYKLQSSANMMHKPISINMQGVVIRKNKKNVVFINNGNTLKSSKIGTAIRVNVKAIKKPLYKVEVQVKQQKIYLKPGQQWHESNKLIHKNDQIKPVKIQVLIKHKLTLKTNNTIKSIP